MNNILYLPVSLGEAIDKLTILDIKCEKIKDSRKVNVQKEYSYLYKELLFFLEMYKELYNSMKSVNLIIWGQMDALRDGSLPDEEYKKLCRECVELNDVRFRIKNKINLISNSALKEQKSYKINRIIINLNCSTECINLFILPIKYLSFHYDEIVINSIYNIDTIKNYFHYDNTILYNISLNDLDFIQSFTFSDGYLYTIDEIYEVMNIDKNKILSFF